MTAPFVRRASTLFLSMFGFSALAQNVGTLHKSVGGTVVVVGTFRDAAVIAADSRETDNSSGRHNDLDCKISDYDDRIIFASSGERSLELNYNGQKIEWDSHAFAKQAVHKASSARTKKEFVEEATAIWMKNAERWFTQALATDSKQFLSAVPHRNNILVAGFFAGRKNDGGVLVMYTLISVVPSTNGSPPTAKGTLEPIDLDKNVYIGFNEIAKEIDNALTLPAGDKRVSSRAIQEKNDFVKHNPGKSERELAELWIPYLVKETIKYAPSKAGVGGDIDAIKIDETGIHWFARKANCPATE